MIEEKKLRNDEFLPAVGELIKEGHSVTINVKGYSMRPFLENCRDKVTLVGIGEVKIGDPILAHVEDGRFVLHRVIAIDGDRITLKGDGNVVGVEYCRKENILGIVSAFYRKGRTKPDYTTGKKWKIYSYVWMRLSPIRRYLLAAYRITRINKEKLK